MKKDVDNILKGVKEALARKLGDKLESPPEQIDLELTYEGKPRFITILVCEIHTLKNADKV